MHVRMNGIDRRAHGAPEGTGSAGKRGPAEATLRRKRPGRMMNAPALAYALACGIMAAWPTQASIEGSKHDFRSSGSSDAREICAFCHTPAGGAATADAPLWNPQGQEDGYARLSSFGTSDTLESGSAVGPVSLTCLSCHDGTHAQDASYVGTVPLHGSPESDPLPPVASDPISLTSPYSTSSSDHPVHVSYARGACLGVETDCDPAARAVERGNDFRETRFDMINSAKNWWVDTDEGAAGIRDKSDIILYPRETNGAVGPAIECGSCHDPHDSRQRPVSFLRMPGENSTLCLTCHVK